MRFLPASLLNHGSASNYHHYYRRGKGLHLLELQRRKASQCTKILHIRVLDLEQVY